MEKTPALEANNTTSIAPTTLIGEEAFASDLAEAVSSSREALGFESEPANPLPTCFFSLKATGSCEFQFDFQWCSYEGVVLVVTVHGIEKYPSAHSWEVRKIDEETPVPDFVDDNLRKQKEWGDTIFSYHFTNAQKVTDKSGNGYDGTISGACSVKSSILTLKSGCVVDTPLTSKGSNYTLSFSVRPISSTPGTLFSSWGSSLLAGNGSITNVMLITGGEPYILNYTLPVGVWTDVKLIGINNATYLSVTPLNSTVETVHEFTIKIRDLSNRFIWGNPMAIEAPIAKIGEDTFEGMMSNFTLIDGADEKYAAYVEQLVIGVYPFTRGR